MNQEKPKDKLEEKLDNHIKNIVYWNKFILKPK
jgi:hypothetical protein